MEIKYSETATKQIGKILKGDRKSAVMILDTIESYSKYPQGGFDVKTLKGRHASFKRLRVGNYRVCSKSSTMLCWYLK